MPETSTGSANSSPTISSSTRRPRLPTDDEGVLDVFRMYRTAFPDLQMHAEEVLVSGDKDRHPGESYRNSPRGVDRHGADRQERRRAGH
jgi:hypothetical protein